MILRQWNLSKKPEPSAPILPWMLRPSALQLSRKPRSPAPKPSGKLKPFAPQPLGMQRPREPPRLTHFTRRHAKTIQHLDEQVIQEESKSQIDFLSACQAALQASPIELRGALVASYHLLMGQATTSHPFTLLQGASPTEQPSAPAAPSSLVPEQSPRPKRQHPSPDPVDDMPVGRTTSMATSEGSPSFQQQEVPSGYKVLKQSCSKAFSQDTNLVKETRKEYFKKHSPNFTTNGMHDLSEVFRHMAKTTKLLGSAIYEIQEVWKGPDKLQQANYALSLYRKASNSSKWYPQESPQSYGIGGHTDPDALHHFNGLTHCPWCGKEGQNEGTVINHLWMVHYRLGLVCHKCYNFPSISSDTLHHHSQQNCQPSGEEDLTSHPFLSNGQQETGIVNPS